MSVQFGRWSPTGDQPSPEYLKKVDALLAPYGPDGANYFADAGLAVLVRAFHTTNESRCEPQPSVSKSGAVLTWDGRLDNRSELIRLLQDGVSHDAPDVSIVAAAYARWGLKCFGRLIGDWALAIRDANHPSVILARDFVGIRNLYYSYGREQITWSSVLDPLVLLAEESHALCEEYLAGWLTHFPAVHLTPYTGIYSVPPCCYVEFRPGTCLPHKYWDFDPTRRIRYRTDAQYEEHFRGAFREAVSRRLRSAGPIVAELSGGMDSSAIVCMADHVIVSGLPNAPRVDTLSYYDDSEPNWNERPYFTKVEEKRGRAGRHIRVGWQESFNFDLESDQLPSVPAALVWSTRRAKQFSAWMSSQSARVLLSGIGGDEVMGGVPTPLPELEDLLARARFGALAHSLKVWSLNKRKPWLHLLWETSQRFLPPSLVPAAKDHRSPIWLRSAFVNRNRAALQGYEKRLKLLGPLPSFQDNLMTLDGLRRQLGCTVLNPSAVHEVRYPYLDRDLLEFLYSIPRQQLVRPGQRRSLMRRALAGIVPREILERKRKAFVSRSPAKAIESQWNIVSSLNRNAGATLGGFVDTNLLHEAMQRARNGQEVPVPALMRIFALQVWLSEIERHGVSFGDSCVSKRLRCGPQEMEIPQRG